MPSPSLLLLLAGIASAGDAAEEPPFSGGGGSAASPQPPPLGAARAVQTATDVVIVRLGLTMDENAKDCPQCLDAWRAFQLWKDQVNGAGYELTDGRGLQVEIVQRKINHTKQDCLNVLRSMIAAGEVDHILGAPEGAWRPTVRRLAERHGVLNFQWASDPTTYIVQPGSYMEVEAERTENSTESGLARRLREGGAGLPASLLGGSGAGGGWADGRLAAALARVGGGAARWSTSQPARRQLSGSASPPPVPRRALAGSSVETGARVEFDVNTPPGTWGRGGISHLLAKRGSQTKRWAFVWLVNYDDVAAKHERVCSQLADYTEGFDGTSVSRLPVDTANILSFAAEISAHPEQAPQVIVYCTEVAWTWILQSIIRDIVTPLAEMVGLPIGVLGFESAGESATANYILEPTPGPPIDNSTSFDVFGSYRAFEERFRSAFGQEPGWAALQAASAGVLLTQALRGAPGGNIDAVSLLTYLNAPAVTVATPLGVLNYTEALYGNDRVGVELRGVRQFRPLAEAAPQMLRYRRSRIIMIAGEAVNTSDPLTARDQLTFPRPTLTKTRVEVYPCEGGCEVKDSVCTACPPGRYRPPFSDDFEDRFSCMSCPTNLYASQSGMHTCGRAPENSEILGPDVLPGAVPGFWLGTKEVPKGTLQRCSIAEHEDPPYGIFVSPCHPSGICAGGTQVCIGRNKGPLCGACEAGDSYMGIGVDQHICHKCPGLTRLALQSLAVFLQWVTMVAVMASLSRKAQKKPAHMSFLLLRTMFHVMQVVSIAFEASEFANDQRSGPVVFLVFFFSRQLELLMLDCWAYRLGLSPLWFIRVVAAFMIPLGILLMLLAHAVFVELRHNLTHFRAIMAVIKEAKRAMIFIEAEDQPKYDEARFSVTRNSGIRNSGMTALPSRTSTDGSRNSGMTALPFRTSTDGSIRRISGQEFQDELEMWEEHKQNHTGGFWTNLWTQMRLMHRQISAGLEFALITAIVVNVSLISINFEAVMTFDGTDDLTKVNVSHKVVLAMSFISLTFGLLFDRSVCSKPTSLLELVLSLLDLLDFVLFVSDIAFEAGGVNRRIIFLVSYLRLVRITGLARVIRYLLDALLQAYKSAFQIYAMTRDDQVCFSPFSGELEGQTLYSKRFTIEEAKIVASSLPSCGGFCFQKPVELEVDPGSNQAFMMFFKDGWMSVSHSDFVSTSLSDSLNDLEWHSFAKQKYSQEVGLGAAYYERLNRLQVVREKSIRWPLMLGWVMVSFPTCLRIILKVTHCISLGPESVLDFDTRMKCDGSNSTPIAGIAMGAGVPLLLFLLSAFARSRDPQAIETRNKFGMLVIGYKLSGWYWEALTFLFFSLLCFASHVHDPVLRMFVMSAMVVTQLVATSVLHPMAPYARDTTFHMEILGLLCALVMLAGSEPIVEDIFPEAGAALLPYFFKIRTAVFVSAIVFFFFVFSCTLISLPLQMIEDAGGSVTYINRVAEGFAFLLKQIRGVNPVSIYYENGHQVLDVSKLSLGEKHLLASNLAKLICAALEYEGGLHVSVVERLLESCFANARNARAQQLRSIYEQHGTLNHAIAPCCGCFKIALRAPDIPLNDSEHHDGVSIEELILAVNEILQDIMDPMTLVAELNRPVGAKELAAMCEVQEDEATKMEATIRGLERMRSGGLRLGTKKK